MAMDPQELRWGTGERSLLRWGLQRKERGEKGARRQESKILPEKGKEFAQFGWRAGRGEAAPAS